MAFNLLQLAKFINGERPSADKFNSIFQFIESRLRGIDISIGQNITDGSNDVTIIDSETSETTSFKVAKKGFKQKDDNEYVLGARSRNLDVSSLMSFIGSASNLNPLMLNELQTIKEIIPAGVTEYNTKYPVFDLALSNYLTSLNSSSFVRRRINNLPLEQDGDFYLGYRNSISINNTTYTTEITWCKPTETSLELEYVFNPEIISNSMLSYQGASYNTIPDFNTPKNASSVFVGNEEYFYNLKFSERDSEGYVTITLPYAKYVSLNVDNQETSELNSGNPTFHNQIKLPEIFKEIQLESGVSQFLIPKGLLYLVHFDNPAERLIDNDYIYVNETTIKVSGISDDLLNCLLAEPGAENYKQMHLLTVGTDITTSLLDIRNKLSSHNHDGSFGEEKIHIKNIEGIYEYRSIFNSRVYYPTKLQGHIATQYLHRDGYRYNSDPQNADNAILGDLLLKGNSDNSSFKLFFGEEVPFLQSFSTGQALLPGYLLLTSNLKFSWIGLSSNFLQSETDISFNIQGSENSHVSIISNRDLNIASKDKIVSIIKNVNTLSESGKILDSSYEWPSVKNEQSVQLQTEDLNANINQNQISLYNNNNNIDLLNFVNLSPQIRIENQNKDIEESSLPDQFGNSIGLNSIYLISKSSGIAANPEIFSSDKNLMQLYTEGVSRDIFQIKESFYGNKTNISEKDFFKKFIPSYFKEYSTSTYYPDLLGQNGSIENTKIEEINNSTKKKEGCFVYVIQHLIDDRNNPIFIWNNNFVPTEDNLNPTTSSQDLLIQNRLHKKTVFNRTFDIARKERILSKNSAYIKPQDLYFRWFGNLNLFNPNSNTGVMQRTYFNGSSYEESYVPILHTNQLGGGKHYNNFGFSGPYESSYISTFQLSNIRRLYKYNPFPSSKEYINQHFYMYNQTPTTSGSTYFNRSTLEILTKNESLESDLSYDLSFKLSKVLTKIVWKKFWLKENVNSNSFDFEELLENSSESFNNEKYILVNQGFLIDCAIPPTSSQSIETYNWDLSGEKEEKARENNYKRVCEFYEVDKTSDFYKDYPNWIAGKDFEVEEILKDINGNIVTDREKALTVEINGGLPFLQHGNLQTSQDFESFFSYFKKHKFEDDNIILYFGKGFVDFHEMNGDYSGELNYDIVIDNHWGTSPKVELNRTLNIEIEDSKVTDRNYKSNQNIKIVLSDFNGENLNLINEILSEENKIHNSFIFSGTGGPASSVTQYLWKTWRANKDWNEYENYRDEIFKYNLDSKLYTSHTWLYGVLLNIDNNSQYSNLFTQEFNLFKDLSLNKLINTNPSTGQVYIDQSNSLDWNKHLNFLNSYPFINQVNLFGLNILNNSTHFFSNVKPRTFFTFINIKFDKNPFDALYKRKLNNQVILKTNASSNTFNNSNNLIFCLKNTSETEFEGIPIKYYNIGPIQGFYDIEIDRFINNERSYFSIANSLLLNEKFGCSLFNIKVNVDMNFCFVC